MALEKQTANVNLTGSLDTKTEPFTVEANGMLIAENVDYEYPNKLIKQKGLDDFNKDVIINTDFTTKSVPLSFSDDFQQYNLLKNNDVLSVIPRPSSSNFMNYDNGDELFKVYNSITKQSYASPLQISDSFSSKFETTGNDRSKVWGSWFDVAPNTDMQIHVMSLLLSYEIDIRTNGTRKNRLIQIANNIVQIRCAIWESLTNDYLDSRFMVMTVRLTAGVASMNIDFFDNNIISISSSLAINDINDNKTQFDHVIYGNNLYIVYYTKGNQFAVARYSITTSLLSYVGTVFFTPTVPANATHFLIQQGGVILNTFEFFYIDSNRDVSLIEYNLTSNTFTLEKSNAIPKDILVVEAGAILNQPIGLSCGSYRVDKSLVCVTVIAEDAGVPINGGFLLRTNLYRYNSTTLTYNVLKSWYNIGSPTRIKYTPTNFGEISFYLGLSSGLQYRSELFESDLIVYDSFDDSTLTVLFPKIVARYNLFAGYGAFSPSMAFDFSNPSGRENGRNLFYGNNTISVGSRSVSLRSISPELKKNYDYKFFTFNNDGDVLSIKFQRYNLLVGAVPTSFDGTFYAPLNSSTVPFIYFSTPLVGGGSLPAGTYSFCYYIENLNFDGSIERSPISNTVQVTIAGPNDRAGFRIGIENFKDDNIKRITYKLFMTEASGTVFYLVYTSTDDNSVLAGVIEISALPDTTSEILYTQGGVLESQILPPITYAHNAKSRIFAINGEDRNEILFSNKIISGELPSFNGLLALRQDSENSARNDFFIGISSMDDKVIVFKRSNLFYFYGDGPNELGTGGAFTELFKISTDVGCSEPKSIVQTPLGVMFKSLKGYYLLGRDLSIIRIGEPIDAYQSLACNNATLLEKKNEVRFLTDSLTICYNYEQGKWSIIKYGGIDATIYNDDYYILQRWSPNALFKLSSSSFLDDLGNPLTMRIVTPWYKVSQIQDFGRFYHAYILGRMKSLHDLIVKVYYDYDDSTSDTFTITPEFDDPQYQYRVNIPQQKCESIKFEIYDTNQQGTNESMELIDLTFTVGLKKGTYKINAARRY